MRSKRRNLNTKKKNKRRNPNTKKRRNHSMKKRKKRNHSMKKRSRNQSNNRRKLAALIMSRTTEVSRKTPKRATRKRIKHKPNKKSQR